MTDTDNRDMDRSFAERFPGVYEYSRVICRFFGFVSAIPGMSRLRLFEELDRPIEDKLKDKTK